MYSKGSGVLYIASFVEDGCIVILRDWEVSLLESLTEPAVTRVVPLKVQF